MKVRHCILSFLAILIVGCAVKSVQPVPARPAAPTIRQYTCGYSRQGRVIDVIEYGDGDHTVLFIASIHGNEKAGTPLMKQFVWHLHNDLPLSPEVKVVIMPKVNPDGFAHNTRFNAVGIDLNRNFPADNRTNNRVNGLCGLTEPESRAIAYVIDTCKPRRIVSFHEPLNCIDYDGPGSDLAGAMAKRCDIGVKKLGSRPGSLGAYAGETLGIPIITVEFHRRVRKMTADELWENYSQLVLEACTFDD